KNQIMLNKQFSYKNVFLYLNAISNELPSALADGLKFRYLLGFSPNCILKIIPGNKKTFTDRFHKGF
ncbi:MAG: hypothetical protein Q8910_18690, partial [Bacteroidota bacterium]|nr:hypothetical protein [Bacteroidota bacterium]